MSIFELMAMLLTLSAVFGWINHRYIHLPRSIGLLLMGLLASLLLVLGDLMFPGQALYQNLTEGLLKIDFTDVLMNGMLGFLLFAGALNLDVGALRERAWPVVALAVIGTVISTALVGLAFWGVALAIGVHLTLPWALVFGALISPTDPVAVLSTLKGVHVPKSLEIEMQGEALFNDGVGVVLFGVLVAIAMGSGNGDGGPIGPADFARSLLVEAGGGLALGVVTGYVAYRALKAIDDFPVEVLITLALVAGTYVFANRIGVSGPLSVVAAGVLVGYRAPRDAMSDQTKTYVSTLWTLIDEILNSILFLLMGLEVVVVAVKPIWVLLGLAAIPIVLVARFIAVSTPLFLLRWTDQLSARNVPFLTWAGVRGGISVALALSLPDQNSRQLILVATYMVVLWTIVVQGSTLGRVARHTLGLDQNG